MKPAKFQAAQLAVERVTASLWPLIDEAARTDLINAQVLLRELHRAADVLAVPHPISDSERDYALRRLSDLFIVPQEITQ